MVDVIIGVALEVVVLRVEEEEVVVGICPFVIQIMVLGFLALVCREFQR